MLKDFKFLSLVIKSWNWSANLVIEIDGQQHKEEIGRVIDSIRDNHLTLSRVLTARIDTKDFEARNEIYFEKIEIFIFIKCSITLNFLHFWGRLSFGLTCLKSLWIGIKCTRTFAIFILRKKNTRCPNELSNLEIIQNMWVQFMSASLSGILASSSNCARITL